MSEFVEYRGFQWMVSGLKDSELSFRDHEDWLYQYIPQDPSAVVIDVGAFVGQFALEASRLVGQVIAFEPLQEAREVLHQNILRNNIQNVTVLPYAVGACERLVDVEQLGSASFVTRKPGAIQQVYLDRALIGEPRIDFMKIDVEGYEVEVVHGAIQTIIKHRPTMLIEVHSHYQNFPHNGNRLNEAILHLGYRGRRVHENSSAYYYVLYEPDHVVDTAN